MSTTITSMETSSESRRPPASERHPQASTATTPLILAAFAAVYILWGSTYLAIRVGVETVPPLMLAGLRHFTVWSLPYPSLPWQTGVRPHRPPWKTGGGHGC